MSGIARGVLWFGGFSTAFLLVLMCPVELVAVRLGLLWLLVMFTVVGAGLLFFRFSGTGSVMGGLLCLGLIGGMVLEAVSSFLSHSDPVVYSLAGERWREKYWYPRSAQGLRDQEYSTGRLVGKRLIVFVGDSITAGGGIPDISNRFPDTTGRILNQQHVVMNLGLEGSGTREQLNHLKATHLRADVVVLQYFPDDILSTIDPGKRVGLDPRETPVGIFGGILMPFVYRSYALNALAVSAAHSAYPTWRSYLRSAYHTPGITEAHGRELSEFAADVMRRGMKLMVVFFPFEPADTDSRVARAFVSATFETFGVPVLDAEVLAAKVPREEWAVSTYDYRPSARVHAEVGRGLYNELKARAWVE